MVFLRVLVFLKAFVFYRAFVFLGAFVFLFAFLFVFLEKCGILGPVDQFQGDSHLDGVAEAGHRRLAPHCSGDVAGENLHRYEADDGRPPEPEAKAAAGETLVPLVGHLPDVPQNFFFVL